MSFYASAQSRAAMADDAAKLISRGRYGDTVGVSRDVPQELAASGVNGSETPHEELRGALVRWRFACVAWAIISLITIILLAVFLGICEHQRSQLTRAAVLPADAIAKRALNAGDAGGGSSNFTATPASPNNDAQGALKTLQGAIERRFGGANGVALVAAYFVAHHGYTRQSAFALRGGGEALRLNAVAHTRRIAYACSSHLSGLRHRASLPRDAASLAAIRDAARLWNATRCARDRILRADGGGGGIVRAALQHNAKATGGGNVTQMFIGAANISGSIYFGGWMQPAFFTAVFGSDAAAFVVSGVLHLRVLDSDNRNVTRDYYEVYFNELFPWVDNGENNSLRRGVYDVRTLAANAFGAALGLPIASLDPRSPMSPVYSGAVLHLSRSDMMELCKRS